MFDLAQTQAAIGQCGFDGWLHYDFRGSNLLARVDPMSLIGGLAFLLLLALSCILLVIWLSRMRRDLPGAAR